MHLVAIIIFINPFLALLSSSAWCIMRYTVYISLCLLSFLYIPLSIPFLIYEIYLSPFIFLLLLVKVIECNNNLLSSIIILIIIIKISLEAQ